MSGDYVLVVEGLDSLGDIESLDADILRNARNAINKAIDRARTSSARDIRESLNFPARYLNTRLTVSQRASGTSLQAKISGRDRPTSLARFATNRTPGGRSGVRVQVGLATKLMKRAFLMKLNGGNLGLAIRLKEGESITGKKKLVKVGKGLYLLYGPSVDQAFATVIPDQEQDTADFLEREFLRLMDL